MKTKNYFFLLMICASLCGFQLQASNNIFNSGNSVICNDVTQLSVPTVSNNSATISWTDNNPGNTWDIAVGLSTDTDPNTLTYVSSTITLKPITNLLFNTNYKVWVRAVCQADGNGAWVGPVLFSTNCSPVTSFYENFDSAITPELANCWTKILRGEGLSVAAKVQTASYNSISAPNTVEITNWGSNGNFDIILVSPEVTNLSSGTHRLRFNSKGIATLQIGTVTTNTNAGVFSFYQDITSTAVATEYVIDFDAYSGTDLYLAIRLSTSVPNNYIFLDNITWEAIPACDDVTNISVASVTPNTADLIWTPGGAETSWDVAIGATTDTDPSTLTFENVSEASYFTATDLETSTNYKAWVRSVCGEENGSWIGPVFFKTDCEAVSSFNETFADVIVPALPSCWSKILRGSGLSSNPKVETSSDIIISGQNSAYLASNASSGQFDIILVSPNVSSLSQGTHRLKFFAKFASTIEVGTLNSNTNTATFNLIQAVTTANGLAEYIVDFSTYTGTDNYLGFRIPTPSPLYANLSLDNIVWEPIPNCPEVTDVNAPTVTSDTAIIDWTSTPTETSWEIAYGATTVTDPNTATLVDASESPFQLIELSPSTTYRVWVRAVCEDSNGAWIGPVTFTTECPPVATFIQNFDTVTTPALPVCWSKILRGQELSQYAYIETSSANNSYFPNFTSPNHIQMNAQGSQPTADIILVSSKVSTLSLGNHRLKFDTFYPGSLQIGTLDGNTDTAIFTPLQTVEAGGFTGSSLVVNFSSYTGSDTYIGIRLVPDTDILPSVNLDNIVWEPIPNCPDVTQISVANTSQTTATIAWTAGGNEASWEVAVGESNVSDPNTLTAEPATETTLTVDELTASTTYKVWVRSVCTDENGAWIGPILFLTPCTAVDVPYTEDFQTAVVPALPLCTSSQVTYTGSNNWVSHNGASSYGFTTKALRYYDSMDTANAWFFTRAINLVQGQTYKISYKKGTNSNLSWMGANLKVMYGTSPFATSMTTTLANHVDFYGMGITENINFTVPVSGVYYFSFNVYSNAYASSVFVDNIIIEAVLDTPENDFVKLNYYPNPVDNILNISHTQNISTILVYNMLGQQVLMQEINANDAKVNMSDLSKGTYMVKITSEDISKIIKVIKN